MNEEWRDVVGYEGYYQVSNSGRVKALSRVVPHMSGTRSTKECIMSLRLRHDGYHDVCLRVTKVHKMKLVHRLVAEAFLPNLDNKPEVNHINGDKSCQEAGNLEWVTTSENGLHSRNVLGNVHGPQRWAQ